MVKIATYTMEGNRKIFSSEINAVEMVKDGKSSYVKISNSTFTLPKVQANENQILVLQNEGTDKEVWTLEEKVIEGIFWNKQNGEKAECIYLCDISLYTEIPPLTFYGDGTTQFFNEALNSWEYNNKGVDLLQIESENKLNDLKLQKKKELEDIYNQSRLITIKNGETIYIKYNTKEREEFTNKIEQVQKEDKLSNVTVSYFQPEGGNVYEISFVPYVWTFIFSELFMSTRASGLRESSRYSNKKFFTIYSLKIENAQTIESLNSLEFTFDNPDGIIININEKAIELLANTETPEWIKQMILYEKQKDPNGEIHLIKKEKCQ